MSDKHKIYDYIKSTINELECTISYDGDLKLDCYFTFKAHEEDEP